LLNRISRFPFLIQVVNVHESTICVWVTKYQFDVEHSGSLSAGII